MPLLSPVETSRTSSLCNSLGSWVVLLFPLCCGIGILAELIPGFEKDVFGSASTDTGVLCLVSCVCVLVFFLSHRELESDRVRWHACFTTCTYRLMKRNSLKPVFTSSGVFVS